MNSFAGGIIVQIDIKCNFISPVLPTMCTIFLSTSL